jgi:hypothetical protein
MVLRPNFTGARLTGGQLHLSGVSDERELGSLVGIQVFVSQGAEAAGGSAPAHGFVARANTPWTAVFDAPGIVAGPAMAIGVETHESPTTSIVWAEQVEIHQ